ncbi:MAG: aspartyl protease family protein [Steroidobacteraceae bacterium]
MIPRTGSTRPGVLAAAAALTALLIPGPRALARCTLAKLAELPVTMRGLQPTVPVRINGADARFLVDSGLFYSMISSAVAAQFKLYLEPAPYHLRIKGVGGSTDVSVTTVSQFTLAGIPLRHVQFIVGGSDFGGVIGENILRLGDTEYDLATGAIRLWRPEGCGKAMLSYWVKDPKSQSLSVIDIDWINAGRSLIIGTAELDGRKIRVVFDTGSGRSMLARRAAERAGFRPDGPGVRAGGFVRGIGSQVVKSWIATFPKFDIGGEEVRNAQLRVADLSLPDFDMLIGADFFLSHRIYVALSQNLLYFTYDGGPVFNLSRAPLKQASSAPAAEPASSRGANGAEPADAAGFSRRGMAFAARHELDRAIADLTRACELAPAQASYLYQLGQLRLAAAQPRLALDDFNQALKLDPNDAGMLVSRARLRLRSGDHTGAVADVEAAERLSPKRGDIRLTLAGLYVSAGLYAPAVSQFDLWIDGHAEDSRRPGALNGRCRARALAGQDLRRALNDCNMALRLRPGTADFLDSRALVELRLGVLDKSIEDYDAALRVQPNNAWSLYSRGVAELRKGLKAEGRKDIAAAVDLMPRVVDLGRARGVTP